MRKVQLIVALMCVCFSVCGQNIDDDFKIDITASSAFEGTNLLINIQKHTDSIKLIYKLLDSVSYKALFKDKRYNELKIYGRYPLNIKTSRDSLLMIDNELNAIQKKYTFYNTDSLVISTNFKPSYTKMLYEIVLTNTDSLENKKKNADRLVMDGVHFFFNIKIGNTQKTAQAHSPTKESHPMLYELLEQTLEVYRRTKLNMFLSRGRTDYY